MTKKQAIDKADKAFADFIKARDGRCVTCGSTKNLDCSHVFRRWHQATRWNPANAYAQCKRCHMIHHKGSESYLLDEAKKRLGETAFNALRDNWQEVSDFKTYQLEEFARYFQEQTANLKAKGIYGN